ncbi:MAG TPA: TonB-dependent receptor plug domain-containing protein, partial [Hyphomonadaceae bacterium]|nr:TonB-dependent receptor plug domain-containing protein [Hyphomonadaceae bacterium]
MSWGRLTSILVLAGAAAPGIAWAQDVIPAKAEADQAASNVTPYKPDFFAQFRPNSALDMVTRIPGFLFSNGSSDRGFSGTSGNVLIDGQRPPSRSDSLSSVLSRIPATAVERIDVIRGSAPGIDMQGLPIMANVIRKKDAGLTGSVGASVQVDRAWSASPNATLQVQNQSGGQTLEGALNYSTYHSEQTQFRARISSTGDLLLAGDSVGFQNDFKDLEATGSWEAPFLDGKLRANAKIGHETSTFSNLEKLLFPGGQQDSSNDETTDSGEVGIRYSRNIGGFGVELVGFQSLSKEDSGDTFNTPDFTSGDQGNTKRGESILRADVKTPALGAWSFDTGAEAVYNYSDAANVRLFDGQVFALDGDASHVDEIRGEAFG